MTLQPKGYSAIPTKPNLQPSLGASLWQIADSLIPFIGMLVLMFFSLRFSYILTLALSVVTGGFVVRLFIIQHDCGHYSYFKSRRANDLTGWLLSLVTFTPYFYWRKQHAVHHATTGNLDKRGHGDMTLYTVREYLALSRIDRIRYRIYRNPFMFLILGPLLLMLFNNRMVRDKVHSTPGERLNVHLSNILIVVLFGLAGWWIGFRSVAMIVIPTYWISSAAGIWLFYVQHQFDPAYWKRNSNWSYNEASLHGSSYLKLPRLLQWFTGNIGFHHIHHLKISVPNYRLQRAFESSPDFRNVHTLTFWSSFKTMFLSLWDEEQKRLIRFGELRRTGVLERT